MIELSANQYVCPDGYGTIRFLDEAVGAGYGSVALTRAALGEMTPDRLRRELDTRGLSVTTLNSAGFFTWAQAERRAAQRDENRRLIDAAAEIGASSLCIITGGCAEQPDIALARDLIGDGLAELDELAAGSGVRLGIEPIHPRDAPTKGCVNSIAQADTLIAPLHATGLILDLFHSWWDPDLLGAMGGADIRMVQICNVTAEPRRTADLARGILNVRKILENIVGQGYRGPFEFEVFAADHGQSDVAPILQAAMDWSRD